MNCDEVSNQITNYINNEINAEDKKAIESHLGECNNCQEYLKSAENVQAEFGRVLEMAATGAVPPSYSWDFVKQRMTGRHSRQIPSLDSIKRKAMDWGKWLWARPLWQKALAGVLTVAITTALIVSNLVGLIGSPRTTVVAASELLGILNASVSEMESFHMYLSGYTDHDDERQYYSADYYYTSPDKWHYIQYTNDGRAHVEAIVIGGNVYSHNLITTTKWRAEDEEMAEWWLTELQRYQDWIDPEHFAASLARIDSVDRLPDANINGVRCEHYRYVSDLYQTMYDAHVSELETATDPERIDWLQNWLEQWDQTVAAGEDLTWLVTLEYWIGVQDRILRQRRITTEDNMQNFTFVSFNETYEIEEPVVD